MNIIRGIIPGAKKVVIYGPEGIGKSTFASRFPDPVFIDTEGGTKEMDVARFEPPTSWQMLQEQIGYVKRNPDTCKTLVIDTVDWAEQMCVEDLCARNRKKGIEDFGYGNGYVYAKEEFGRFLNLLNELVAIGINTVLTAHAQIRKFEQPDEMGAYDRYELKLGKKTSSQTSPLVKEWADMMLFANYKTYSVAVDEKGKKHKAQGGERVMYSTHHPCWDAKNRYGLPEVMPFAYEAIAHVISGRDSNDEAKSQAVEEANAPVAAPVQNRPAGQTEEEREEPAAEENGQMNLPLAEDRPDNEPFPEQDPMIPKQLRDLMMENRVCEWDIQNVVAARGYFPADMPVRDYPEDFVMGVLVGAWKQVHGMIRDMKSKYEIPFN